MKNNQSTKKIGITEVVLRDGHQSLLATRFRYEDMENILKNIDDIGYWSVESWGGAVFDSCIRYLGEDPWERIRKIKALMPNTPQQMLLRGQNLLGYKHYGDDVVDRFVDKAKLNGVDVFRIFDAMNDVRNLEQAIKSTIKHNGHAQGTISYTTSPVHNLQRWVDLSNKIQDMGAHSLAIKDMAGLLKPYAAFQLVTKLKESIEIPIHLHCHATTGMSTPTIIKAIEAGVDNVDTSISSMSMTYGHTATETVVGILENTPHETDIDLEKLVPIASHFKKVREKYAEFEGSLKGIDARIISSQVPGGMLTNFVTIRKAVKKMSSIDRMKQDGTFNSLSKKEKLQIGRLRDKLEKNLGSISNMTRLPGAIFIVDILREKIAVKEAQKLNIPIFAMVDTNCDPRGIDYVIPSNDDASKSISKILEHVGAAVLEGLEERNSSKEKEEDNSKTEEAPAPKQEVKEESETKKEVKKEAKSKDAKESSVAKESKETDDKKTKKAKK